MNKLSEAGPYGIASDVWPGVGKTVEEMNELGEQFGKLLGSSGDRFHWTGDLVPKIRGEIADLRAALDFLEEANPILTMEEHRECGLSGRQFMEARHAWKLELFRSWQRDDPPELWPRPDQFGLQDRDTQ